MAKTLLLTLCLPCVCLATMAQWSEEKKWADPDGSTSFGDAVDIDGNTIIVGARNVGTQAGAAYIYRNNTNVWKEYKLTETVQTANHYFGQAVCLKGDLAVVTTYAGSDDGGSAQIFTYNSSSDAWDLKQRITGLDEAGTTAAYYGGSCSTDGMKIVIGAHKAGGVANDMGAAYVYKMNSTSSMWTREAKLQASDGALADYFAYPSYGGSVSIKGDMIICGAPFADSNGSSSTGKAYIFKFNSTTGNWTEEQKLEASGKMASDYFGSAVDIDGNVAVIGARSAKVDGVANRGKVWIFRKNSTGTWIQEASLTLPQTSAGDAINTNFGSAVAVEGNRMVAGARYYKSSGIGLRNCGSCTYSGAVQTYMYNGTWNTEQIFYASNGNAYNLYGSAVAMDGNQIVVGGAHSNTKAGNAYLMQWLTPAPSSTSGSTSSSNTGSTISTNGSSSSSSSSSSSGSGSETSYTGKVEVTMSSAHADALTSNLTNAKAIFKTAIATTSGLAESKVSISKIYKGGVEVTGRRLTTGVVVRADWTIMSTSTVNATAWTESALTTNVQTAAANAPVAVTITITAASAGATASTSSSNNSTSSDTTQAPGTTSGCTEWSMWTSLVAILIAFLTLV